MATYETPDELPDGAHTQLEKSLTGDERFVMAVRDEKFLATTNPFFIVTDRRLIQYRSFWVSETFTDILFDRLSRVEYHQNPGAGTLELTGTEFQESYSLFNETGRPLADEIRKQLAKQDQTE
ncbi:hypothetical protein C448_06308 [Halococcus morrhuae DSM 1307]|uniref:YokE-like PH domain-containing protein n=1 Tax=Halococcus morrhuae DSM 1307 TaxID=931277 RepID=M0ML26_HALMO|nr:PH domain-containing protein [Halococcus morrhuae]EMA46371.1 hypothetical protein C448_06308 [Halococcus morrhuae DSM 1307]